MIDHVSLNALSSMTDGHVGTLMDIAIHHVKEFHPGATRITARCKYDTDEIEVTFYDAEGTPCIERFSSFWLSKKVVSGPYAKKKFRKFEFEGF